MVNGHIMILYKYKVTFTYSRATARRPAPKIQRPGDGVIRVGQRPGDGVMTNERVIV